MWSIISRGTVRTMLAIHALFPDLTPTSVAAGTAILRRAVVMDTVTYIVSGSVLVGVLGTGASTGTIEHHLGTVEGPSWLEPTAAVLDLPCAVDAVAQSDVVLFAVPLAAFRAIAGAGALEAHSLLQDIARLHRQQTELTVSRLAKDAEARCAEWLLQHSQTSVEGGCLVHLQLRKRAIAAQLGIAPETLSRVLRHLRELRLISGSGRTLDLVDPVGLRTLAGTPSTA